MVEGTDLTKSSNHVRECFMEATEDGREEYKWAVVTDSQACPASSQKLMEDLCKHDELSMVIDDEVHNSEKYISVHHLVSSIIRGFNKGKDIDKNQRVEPNIKSSSPLEVKNIEPNLEPNTDEQRQMQEETVG
ncbi:uncharacterized protein G2W53_010963 [Senna tora]|uniref:Uncharacterized protein n=1 Tax=Senna tora TaxID=362788 RepID=A0A834X191_9FABA|nr:uncharacterized protein G2W53_010963 [Senna tora]